MAVCTLYWKSLSMGCQMFAAGSFFIAVTANVGRQASLGAWNIVLLVLVLVLVSVQPSRSSKLLPVCECSVLWCSRP